MLPHDTIFNEVTSVDDAYSVIKKMQVRGAPLIATVGTLGLGVELEHRAPQNYNELLNFIGDCCQKLIASRPTAVNLRNAIQDIEKIIDDDKTKAPDATRLVKR